MSSYSPLFIFGGVFSFFSLSPFLFFLFSNFSIYQNYCLYIYYFCFLVSFIHITLKLFYLVRLQLSPLFEFFTQLAHCIFNCIFWIFLFYFIFKFAQNKKNKTKTSPFSLLSILLNIHDSPLSSPSMGKSEGTYKISARFTQSLHRYINAMQC